MNLVYANFEVITAVKIHLEFLCVVTPCSVVVGHRRFGGPFFHSTPR